MKKLLLLLTCGFACSYNSIAQLQLVSTLAGHTASGTANGTGTIAGFNLPGGVCVDLSGNVYVGDNNNHLIRKITASGVVTTLAGSGTGTFVNGTGTGAAFNHPLGLCADGSGNIYVADSYNNMIRKITPGGVVSTYAGNGNPGAADGPAASATFLNPVSVCCDIFGNIYVVDQYNQKIRKISTTGSVTTLAGSGSVGSANGSGTLAAFNYPQGITVDASGNLYVADENNSLIRKIDASGLVSTLAGSVLTNGNTDGVGTAARFNSPCGISCDLSGNIFVGDFSNHRIRKIDGSGNVTTVTGAAGAGYQDGNVSIAKFSRPAAVACYTGGVLYIADWDNNMIRMISPCTAPAVPASSDATVCAGSITTLTATGTGTISWFTASTGGTAVATGSAYITSGTLTAGAYTLYAEAATDCTVSASRTAVVITVSTCCVAPPPPVNTTTPSPYYVFTFGQGTLTATSSGTVSWYTAPTGGTAVATGTAFIVSPVTQGTFTYYASATTCTESTVRTPVSFEAYIPEGLNELKDQTMRIYPNPVSDVVTIDATMAALMTIEVMDVTGRVLISNTGSDAKTQISLGAFAPGIYYVKVKTGKSADVMKVIKH